MELELKNICKSFGEKEVLKGVSFRASSGRAFGFLGRNGAGKTTTIRILMDVFPANSGEVLIDGSRSITVRSASDTCPRSAGCTPRKRSWIS